MRSSVENVLRRLRYVVYGVRLGMNRVLGLASIGERLRRCCQEICVVFMLFPMVD